MLTFALDPVAVVWTVADDEIVAIDNHTAEYFTLNDTAACLWLMLAEGATEADMVARLLREYEPITELDAGRDVREFLAVLEGRAFLRKG